MGRLPIALLLCAALALTLAACGGDDEPEATTSGEAATEPTATTITDPPEAFEEAPDEGETTGSTEGGEGGGAGGQSSGRSDEQLIRRTVTAFLESPDAERVCSELVTERLLERSYGDRAGCIAGRDPATLADRTRLTGLEVSGERAAVGARPSGGLYDSQQLELELISAGRGWQLDTLTSDVPVGP